MGMNVSKYCMTADNKFVIISKYSGLDHSQVALLLADEPISAGFVVEMDNELIAYGQSISLNMKSREEDTQIIQDALFDGNVRSKLDEVTDHWFVGNIDHISMGETSSFDDMIIKRLI